jgi:DNA polymerase-4
MLAESVAERMREDGFVCRTVQISLRDNELFSFERQMKLRTPTCLASELHSAAMQLLRANYDWRNHSVHRHKGCGFASSDHTTTIKYV